MLSYFYIFLTGGAEMNFNSFQYLIFLPVTLLLYFLLPRRLKNPLLLGASYVFYMCWNPAYALLMLLSTALTYVCGILMDRQWLGRRRLWLLSSLGLNLAVLFFFKYFNFFTASLNGLFGLLGLELSAPTLNVLLPVGISFYTFQALGYTMDVYRRDVPAERNFIDYALFVSFFPQLVAGPIERTGNMLPQLKVAHPLRFANLRDGLLPILWGLMKKMLIADNLAVIVNKAYAAPGTFSGLELAFATVCFAFQIYCDFSAYSDIARGSAKLMGIELMQNFNCPYAAESIKDFWRRWHISLSTWFKDYLYFPLGGSRVSKGRHCLNVMIVFTVSGLWHGAAFTYVFWGLLHGLYQVAGILLAPLREGLYRHIRRDHPLLRVLKTLGTFALVCLAWVLFRADSLRDAGHILRAILSLSGGLVFRLGNLGCSSRQLFVLALAVLLLYVVDFVQQKRSIAAAINRTVWLRYAVYLLLLLSIVFFGYYGPGYDPQDFVYFQF